jgi:hypothetical protein
MADGYMGASILKDSEKDTSSEETSKVLHHACQRHHSAPCDDKAPDVVRRLVELGEEEIAGNLCRGRSVQRHEV